MAAQQSSNQKIAGRRIVELFKQAALRPSMAARYVQLAKKMASRYRVRMPKDIKNKFCKGCDTYFVLGKTGKVRIKQGKAYIVCEKCGKSRAR